MAGARQWRGYGFELPRGRGMRHDMVCLSRNRQSLLHSSSSSLVLVIFIHHHSEKLLSPSRSRCREFVAVAGSEQRLTSSWQSGASSTPSSRHSNISRLIQVCTHFGPLLPKLATDDGPTQTIISMMSSPLNRYLPSTSPLLNWTIWPKLIPCFELRARLPLAVKP